MRDSGQGGRAAPGDPGSGSGTGFEALARQYWNAWGDALRSASPGAAQAGTQPWQAALDWWSRAAQGSRVEGNDTFERFNAPAGPWFGQMETVDRKRGGQGKRVAVGVDIGGGRCL